MVQDKVRLFLGKTIHNASSQPGDSSLFTDRQEINAIKMNVRASPFYSV